MSFLGSSVGQQLLEIGSYLMKVDMFPVFLLAHFSLSCLVVREDSKDLGPQFRQKHPFISWLSTVITALAGVFVANFLFGAPLVEVLKDHFLIVFITVVWYLMNYAPGDVVYKAVTFSPVFLTASVLQEGLRIRFIYLGIQQAATVYPESYLIILLGGVIKGNGYGLIKIVERLLRGKWTPHTNELLDITYFTKSGFYASVIFLLHHLQYLDVPIELVYLGILATFIVFRLSYVVGNVKDPLLVVESPFTSLFFGGDD